MVPEFVRHYGLGKRDATKLAPLFRSMPRGRVTYSKKARLWIFQHGDDCPRGNQHFEMYVPSRFGLSKELLHGDVSFAEDNSMTMLPAQQLALQAIIGAVPYRPLKHS
jgi:hypothetical protein